MGPGTPLVEDIKDIDKYGGGAGGSWGFWDLFFKTNIYIARSTTQKLGRCSSYFA
eukprot:SAG31_NODE_45997_length_256_cov_0.834395_1_plen_54_part_10